MLLCLLLGGLAEGVSVSSGVPLIAIAAAPQAPSGSAATDTGGGVAASVSSALRHVGLEPTPGVLLAVLAGGIIVRALLLLLASTQVGYAAAHMATDLRLSLIRAALRSRWEYHVHQPISAFAAAVAAEARRASDAYLHATTLLSLLIQAAVYVVVGCWVSWRAMLVTLLVATLIVAALTRLIRAARRAGSRQTGATQSLLKRLTDALQSVKQLKAMGQEGFVGGLLEADTRQLNRGLRREVASKEAMQALQDPLVIAFLAIGLYAAQGALALPLSTVIVLVVVAGRVIASLGQAQKEVQRMAACESAFWSLRATIAAAERSAEMPSGTETPALRRAVALRDVSFAYDGDAVLSAASLTIPVGELTAVIGPSGSGKTTLADLVIGLLQPQSGAILIDDVPVQSLDAQRWRGLIGYVPQDTFLLHDSVRLNVSLGDPDLSPGDVERALQAAGASEFVAVLPQGLDTIVGERGLRLSGGQRQRIALARALVRRPQLLILDEATAALDPTTEAEVCRTLEQLRGSMTILAICHAGPLIAIADGVYRIEGGRIAPLPERPRVAPIARADRP